MSTVSNLDILRGKYERKMAERDAIIKMVDEAKIKLDHLEEERIATEKAINMIRYTIKEANRYLTIKQENMIRAINASLNAVSDLIKSPSKFNLILKDDKIEIRSQSGVRLKDVEGTGYRAIVATQVKVLALLNSIYSKLIILDEPISQANRQNSRFFVEFLQDVSDRMQIFFISQDASDYLSDLATVLIQVSPNGDGSSSIEVSND